MRTAPNPLRGYLYIALAALLWGISATLGRAAFTGRLALAGRTVPPVDPLILSQSRATFSCVVLAAALLIMRGAKRLRLPGRDLAQMFLLGVLGVAASNYFYYLAIQRTHVATAIILQYTAPVWVLIYAVARGLQKATLPRVGAVLLALAGIALIIGIFGSGRLQLDRLGVIAALLAACSFAFYNIGGHNILARYERWTVLLYVLLGASLFWMLINPPTKIAAAHYAGAQWIFLFAFSLVSVLGPFAFYFAGLQHLEPTRAIVVSCLEPVFSILIATVALAEGIHAMQGVGIALVLLAIVVVQLPDQATHEPAAIVEPIE
jgi:DME family drug/metabolite transporter